MRSSLCHSLLNCYFMYVELANYLENLNLEDIFGFKYSLTCGWTIRSNSVVGILDLDLFFRNNRPYRFPTMISPCQWKRYPLHLFSQMQKLYINKLPTLALKPEGDVTRSPKQGYQWPTKKTDVLQKIYLNKNAFQ